VVAAAHELPKPVLLLRDALRVVLVLAVAAPERYASAAARFGARLVNERRLSVAEAQLVFASLQTLAGPEPLAGGEALCVLLERSGEREAPAIWGSGSEHAAVRRRGPVRRPGRWSARCRRR
jgi:hypothetical protein